MEQYTDTTLLECNRLSSAEHLAGNNIQTSIYTNELNGTIRLEVGDIVSIHGVYISEIGAGSETIEFKGKPLTDYRGRPLTKTYTYTDTTHEWPCDDDSAQMLIGGFQTITHFTTQKTVELFDNKSTITLTYYKTNNGEACYFLPRRFIGNDNFQGYSCGDTVESNWIGNNWSSADSASQGRNPQEAEWPTYRLFLEDDYQFYKDGIPATDTINASGHFIPKNDNQRFTLFKREGTTFYTNLIVQIDSTVPPTPIIRNDQDPAIDQYEMYREPVDIELTTGYNTPSNVSKQITDILRKGKQLKPFMFRDNSGVLQEATSTYETNTWKPMRCSSDGFYGEEGFNEYYAGTAGDNAFKYYACYENIWVKRPELWITGRACNSITGVMLRNTVAFGDRTTSHLETDYPYDEPTLKKLAAFFKAQESYPEIWNNWNFKNYMSAPDTNGENRTVLASNSRFLHINSYDDIDYSNLYGEIRLGCDMYQSLRDLKSRPIFFKYDKNFENIMTDGSTTDRLSYGFATKSAADTIILHPELVGGIPEAVFQQWDPASTVFNYVDMTGGSRRMGFDFHFNAYSTLVMSSYTGRLKMDMFGVEIPALMNKNQDPLNLGGGAFTELSKEVCETYIGANDPLFNFDSVSSRFYFSRLHTAETAGQPRDQAGGNFEGAAPINTNAADEVWKMNKHMPFHQFTPAIVPYPFGASASMDADADAQPRGQGYLTAPKAAVHPIYNTPNEQIEKFCVFDSHGGVFIEDLGFDKYNFKDGMWGLLGFTWEQFNSVSNDLNRSVRITEENKNALKHITTNCEIVASDTLGMNVNPWGAVLYTTQVPVPRVIAGPNRTLIGDKSLYYFGATQSGDATTAIPNLPVITEKTDSIWITAEGLPRKMLQPYYTIRSDLIERGNMIGGETSNSLFPVMAICDKQYSGGDFVFFNSNNLQFRITKPQTLSSITTSIHDPDGSFARTNEDNCVIYKVVKNMNVRTNLLQDYLEMEAQQQKSK